MKMDGFCYLFQKFDCVPVLENIQSSHVLGVLKCDSRHSHSTDDLNVISTSSEALLGA